MFSYNKSEKSSRMELIARYMQKHEKHMKKIFEEMGKSDTI